MNRRMHSQRGSALLAAVGYVAVISLFALTFVLQWHQTCSVLRRSGQEQLCRNLAEGGIEKAVAELRFGDGTYRGETSTVLGDGRFSVEVEEGASAGEYRLTAVGEVWSGGSVHRGLPCRVRLRLSPARAIEALDWMEKAPW